AHVENPRTGPCGLRAEIRPPRVTVNASENSSALCWRREHDPVTGGVPHHLKDPSNPHHLHSITHHLGSTSPLTLPPPGPTMSVRGCAGVRAVAKPAAKHGCKPARAHEVSSKTRAR